MAAVESGWPAAVQSIGRRPGGLERTGGKTAGWRIVLAFGRRIDEFVEGRKLGEICQDGIRSVSNWHT